MITDRLDVCPFCQTKLAMRITTGGKILDCPDESQHKSNAMWAWFDNIDPDTISAINIRMGQYQLCWSIEHNEFCIIDFESESVFDNEIFTIDKLVDFQLTKEAIENKLKTILVFM